eukprot:766951-Hanusia_phi.AAC.4
MSVRKQAAQQEENCTSRHRELSAFSSSCFLTSPFPLSLSSSSARSIPPFSSSPPFSPLPLSPPLPSPLPSPTFSSSPLLSLLPLSPPPLPSPLSHFSFPFSTLLLDFPLAVGRDTESSTAGIRWARIRSGAREKRREEERRGEGGEERREEEKRGEERRGEERRGREGDGEGKCRAGIETREGAGQGRLSGRRTGVPAAERSVSLRSFQAEHCKVRSRRSKWRRRSKCNEQVAEGRGRGGAAAAAEGGGGGGGGGGE